MFFFHLAPICWPWVGLEFFLFWQKYIRLSLNEEQDRLQAGFQTAVNREIFIGLTVGILLTHKDTSGFMSNTLLIPKQDLSRVKNRSNLKRFRKFLVLNYLEFCQPSNACSGDQNHGSGRDIDVACKLTNVHDQYWKRYLHRSYLASTV